MTPNPSASLYQPKWMVYNCCELNTWIKIQVIKTHSPLPSDPVEVVYVTLPAVIASPPPSECGAG